jgi:glycosyltransferase involved in cell wall biosynthesis
VIEHGPAAQRAVIRDRIEALLSVLNRPVRGESSTVLLNTLMVALADLGPDEAWLAISVLTARLPDVATVHRTVRTARLDGTLVALFDALHQSGQLETVEWPAVEVVVDGVLVDLHHTAQSQFSTGIQRVARETARHWTRQHGAILVGWTSDYGCFRRLSAAEVNAAFGKGANAKPSTGAVSDPVIVPWKCTHLVAELPVEPHRTSVYQSFVAFSRSITGLVGHDCVPLMAAEATAEGMPIGFANYLAVAANADRIAVTCEAAGLEFRGWRTMLRSAGKSGPTIRCIPLAVHADDPTDDALREAGDLLGVGSLPIVLSVGSHEPRKNHLALLHAAEVLWREGLLFSLVFVGGNSWNSGEFDAQVRLLQGNNRPVQTILALSEDLLWAAYRLAYCTVFPSLHEGFGLPVAESLASGTPVITSNFGSMREICSRGGALLVDPRNDQELTDALRRLLLSGSLRNELAAEASRVRRRSWAEYAAAVWAYLVEGADPDALSEPGDGSSPG